MDLSRYPRIPVAHLPTPLEPAPRLGAALGLPLQEMDARMEAAAEELRGRGRRPYIIPVGGSTPLGCLGYAEAVRELAEQARAAGAAIDAMVVAVGSTGTLSGMLVGAREFLP